MYKNPIIDGLFFYLFLPSITTVCIYLYRLYNQKKENKTKLFKISTGIIIGNILLSMVGISTFLFMFFYTIEPTILLDFKWEFISLSFLVYIFLLIGIGIGSHIAGASIEHTLRPHLIKKGFETTSETIHFYHCHLGHKLPYIGILLSTYCLTLLDLFNNQSYNMNLVEISLSIITGVIFGALVSFLSIITESQKIIKSTSLLLIISIIIAITNENINLYQQPVATIFTYFYGSISTLLYVEIYIPRPIIKILKKTSHKLLKWDGIKLNSNHRAFRKNKILIKYNQTK